MPSSSSFKENICKTWHFPMKIVQYIQNNIKKFVHISFCLFPFCISLHFFYIYDNIKYEIACCLHRKRQIVIYAFLYTRRRTLKKKKLKWKKEGDRNLCNLGQMIDGS